MSIESSVVELLLKKYKQVMLLKVFLDPEVISFDLAGKYAAAIFLHNDRVLQQEFVDAGFDLYLPSTSNEMFHSITVFS
jgi:hypothetical protein